MNRATKKRIVYSFLGMEKDRKISADGEKRPSILLATSQELKFDEFHLIWQRGCEELLNKIVNEMREKTVEELQSAIVDWKKDLFNYKLQLSTHKLENTALISNTKKLIAQAKTVIKEKEVNHA